MPRLLCQGKRSSSANKDFSLPPTLGKSYFQAVAGEATVMRQIMQAVNS